MCHVGRGKGTCAPDTSLATSSCVLRKQNPEPVSRSHRVDPSCGAQTRLKGIRCLCTTRSCVSHKPSQPRWTQRRPRSRRAFPAEKWRRMRSAPGAQRRGARQLLGPVRSFSQPVGQIRLTGVAPLPAAPDRCEGRNAETTGVSTGGQCRGAWTPAASQPRACPAWHVPHLAPARSAPARREPVPGAPPLPPHPARPAPGSAPAPPRPCPLFPHSLRPPKPQSRDPSPALQRGERAGVGARTHRARSVRRRALAGHGAARLSPAPHRTPLLARASPPAVAPVRTGDGQGDVRRRGAETATVVAAAAAARRR